MSSEKKIISESDRFRFEHEDNDIPFYNNNPWLSKLKWFVLILSVLPIPFFIVLQFFIKDIATVFPYLTFLIPALGFGHASD